MFLSGQKSITGKIAYGNKGKSRISVTRKIELENVGQESGKEVVFKAGAH